MTDELTRSTKKQVRAEVLASRAALDAETVASRAEGLATHIDDFADKHHADTIAVYASVGTEPGTRLAIDRLHARGVRVLLPVVLPNLDLDWAEYSPDDWQDARMGLVEPCSPRLGLEAISQADVIFCPGVAGSIRGHRLGRGGGCYDRALTRARSDAPRALVVYDDDVLDEVPVGGHDQRVDAIITPTRVLKTTRDEHEG